MIVPDTNVLSELLRPQPADAVLRWIAAQPAAALYVTGISYAEILFGVGLLPAGKRRQRLAEQATAMFTEDFAGRLLGFGTAAAPGFAALSVQRRQAGKPIAPIDAMIAAIAQVHGAAVASRDSDLADCGIPLVNPWETP